MSYIAINFHRKHIKGLFLSGHHLGVRFPSKMTVDSSHSCDHCVRIKKVQSDFGSLHSLNSNPVKVVTNKKNVNILIIDNFSPAT